MKKIYLIALLMICFTSVNAQVDETLSKNDSVELVRKELNKNSFKKSLRVPSILMAAGIFALTDNDILSSREILEERNEHLPQFQVHVDNYLQFAPIGVAYGLNMVGIKGKNNFGDRTAILIKSELIMVALVSPLKNLTHTLRPDGSAHTSFPSGHTAQAFAAATFLHKEYGHINAMYSIGAYGIAASVGTLRVLNNKHYASDVLVGAGIGILATNLAYLTHQYYWSTKKKRNKMTFLPVYNGGGSMGFVVNLKL